MGERTLEEKWRGVMEFYGAGEKACDRDGPATGENGRFVRNLLPLGVGFVGGVVQ